MLQALKALLFPGAVVGVTLAWLWLDRATGWRGPHLPRTGALLVTLGLLMVAWCAGLFLFIGEGSPHPFVAKTKRMVIVGPYRYVRNPMMWGVGTILIGLALWLHSAGLWLGIGCFLLFVSLFIPLYEERDMERRFGEEYRDYCRRVPRWFPRL
jgi:protein-S-isoprenylcysteine O-methyltransferase Ste14